MTSLSRRLFIGSIGTAWMACTPAASVGPDHPPSSPSTPPAIQGTPVPRRLLGKTGESVSMVGIGGAHLGETTEKSAIEIVRRALDRGVTFLDNCWDYHGGKSEERMGKALRDGYRAKAFLMTKIDGRTKDAATAQLDQSLKRLGTDRIDLVQVHEVIRDTDPKRCFAAGGCIEALVAAKQAGKLRFIGFTGHKHPDIHLAMLREADAHGFAFDAVQMPLNPMDPHFRSFEKNVLPVLVEKKIGVLGMKSMGSGILLESKTVTPIECLHYAMNLPTSVVITGCDSLAILDQAIMAAQTFAPLTPEAVDALRAKTALAARDGAYEKFKTSEKFDGTTQNPKWLEGAEV